MTDGFLKQHGCSYDEKTKVFHGEPMDIVRLRIIRDTKDWRGDNSHMLDDRGYLAINSPVMDWGNEEEIQAKTTSVYHVHELQNYLEEVHKVKLEAQSKQS